MALLERAAKVDVDQLEAVAERIVEASTAHRRALGELEENLARAGMLEGGATTTPERTQGTVRFVMLCSVRPGMMSEGGTTGAWGIRQSIQVLRIPPRASVGSLCLSVGPLERGFTSRYVIIQLGQDLWDSIATEPEVLPFTDDQRREIRRRSQAHRENPNAARPLDDVLNRIEHSLE